MLRKKRFEVEDDGRDRWLVSYADFITLMFAFFTVMYATSTKDFEQAKKFEDSIKKAFLVVAQFGKGSGPGEYTHPEDADSPIPPPIEVFQRPNSGVTELAETLQKWMDEKISKEEKDKLKLQIIEDPYGVRVSLDSSSLFDAAENTLKREALPTLDKVAKVLRESGKSMIVEGHTDNQAVANSKYPSNWELAAARAGTIVRYLIKAHGIQPSRLVAVSMADQRPVSTNENEDGRKKNRRIEILLTTKKTGIN